MKQNDGLALKGRVVAVITRGDGSVETHECKNIITSAGDDFYANRAAKNPADTFTPTGVRLGLGTGSATKADTDVDTYLAGSEMLTDLGYPKVDDPDSRNTGAGTDTLTWRYSWVAGAIIQTGISEGAIVDDIVTPTIALNHYYFLVPFDLTNVDALVLYVNHQFVGV